MSEDRASEKAKRYPSFCDYHQQFITKRLLALKKKPIRQRACIVKLPNREHAQCKASLKQTWLETIKANILTAHQHNAVAWRDKTVSFGVIRVANNDPCIELSRYLMATDWGDEVEVRVMSYTVVKCCCCVMHKSGI